MDIFRISLIVVGVTVLLGIYLFDSNKNIRSYLKKLQFKQFFLKNNDREDEHTQEPEINDDPEILEHIEQMGSIVSSPYSGDATDEISVSPGDEMVLAFFIISRGDHYFTGTDIRDVCMSNGFEFSNKNTYEKFSDTNLKDKRPVACIVNSFEPGTFDSDFENFDTRAITLLLFLPGPDGEMAAFDDVILRAKNIAKTLKGELCDETRSVLTQQTISHLEEKIEAFQFKNKMLKTSLQH